MQVLFSEQVKMRSEMQEKEKAPNNENSDQDGNHLSTDSKIIDLKEELERVKAQMAELQNDYSELQQEYEKLSNKQKNIAGWGFGWKKIKNSFHTRVDEDEPAHQRPSRTSSRMTLRRRLSMT